LEEDRSKDFKTLLAAYPVSASGVATLQKQCFVLGKKHGEENLNVNYQRDASQSTKLE